jgi:hypothetical protein
MSRTFRPLAALAMLAVIVAGCSNAPAGTGTGSSGGNSAAATHEKAVKGVSAATGRNPRQRVFVDFAVFAATRFATGCHRCDR